MMICTIINMLMFIPTYINLWRINCSSSHSSMSVDVSVDVPVDVLPVTIETVMTTTMEYESSAVTERVMTYESHIYMNELNEEFDRRLKESLGLSSFNMVMYFMDNDDETAINAFVEHKSVAWNVYLLNVGLVYKVYRFAAPEERVTLDEYPDHTKDFDQVDEFIIASLVPTIRDEKIIEIQSRLEDKLESNTYSSDGVVQIPFSYGSIEEEDLIAEFAKRHNGKLLQSDNVIMLYEFSK